MDSKSEQGCDRHTLTDVIFFDLEELQGENALLPSSRAPSLEEAAPPPRASLRPSLTAQRASLSPAPRPSPRPAARPSQSPRPSLRSERPSLSSLQRPSLSQRPGSSSLRPSSPQATSSRASLAHAHGSSLHAHPSLSVSILTFATTDATGLARKLENTLAMCRRSRHKAEIVVGCDGHDQAVLAVARSYEGQGVRVLSSRQTVGPLAMWAQVTHASQFEVLLFTDVNARMAPDSLDLLLAPMRDPNVGMTVPSYVPCVEDAHGVRARLEAASHGITAASYAGVAVRRRLVRRPAHDTLQPGLVAALQVLGGGHGVVSLPSVRVFHPQINSARASFARIAQHTQGQLQAALRQRDELLAARKGMFFVVLREGLKHIPLLAAWLGCVLGLALLGFGLHALLVLLAGALCIARSNWKLAGAGQPTRLDRLGASLTAGAAQAYGMVLSRTISKVAPAHAEMRSLRRT